VVDYGGADSREVAVVKVLAVDDDPTILRLLQVNLEMDGHEVHTADDGEAALERVREVEPEILLLDVMMPHLDGWEVCERLRADPANDHLPIVFLSARAQESDLARGTAVGADAYITKPFDPLALVELVERLARDGR
jgi:DNA-binding response OmpR family regulator